MTKHSTRESEKSPGLGRRELLAYSAAFGASFVAANGLSQRAAAGEADKQTAASPLAASAKRYDMKKSINMWAFPYPDKMSLKECFQLAKDAGFDGIEPNFNLEGEFSAESSEAEIKAIGQMAKKIGLEISGVC